MYTSIPFSVMDIFKQLPESTRRFHALKNILVVEPAPVYAHQDILGSINYELYSYVRRHKLGKVLVSPVDVYLNEEHVFQPDILFISNRRLPVINKKGIFGAPDLIVEILSPSTAKYDRGQKKDIYERCGVSEYWLVDPETCVSEGFHLKNGSFQALPAARGIIKSVLLGETFRFQ
ncbi:putative restriction endonuclease [Anseongella ginsenosidimutans]|uniref:Putative restriction endonuclease n=1 Tax=Anseongella ginsenosidimutans TaxID=496056 RepID=A0A4R3KLF0_9SPHI|nr:Uma2 family endonuclease [Anseongella ginsenosidimutans]QEC52093.1 Uma2 family endonuclease [Anseongella ginsenosidimutans]TCS84878.1 putative restriction endonuclease [Anseongella ginsenosidimutans]